MSINRYFSLVKFSHTIFALPFALIGFFLGITQLGQPFSWKLLGLMLLCMVFARSAAMAFNRYIDRDIDGKNPRTATREIPAGAISPSSALYFVIANSLGFVLAAWFINPMCFYLSPVALFVILFYSYTKRFTWACHFVLGLGLALAPIGAYLAAGGSFDMVPLLYSGAVLCWVSGFDIIYALQDEEFDKSLALQSIPVRLGTAGALRLSSVLHILCAIFIVAAAVFAQSQVTDFGWLLRLGTAIFVGLLAYQHTVVKASDLSRVNLAFFTTNGMASVLLSLFFLVDLLIV